MQTADTLVFSEPTVEDAAWAEPALRALDSPLCEYNFATVYMWRKWYGHRIARVEDRLLLESRFEGKLSFLFPAGAAWKEDLLLLQEYAHRNRMPLMFYGADEVALAELDTVFPGQFRVQADPEDADYIYRRSDLADLPGKLYQKKRNHVSAFCRAFPDWKYETLTDGNAADALALAERWYREAAPLTGTLQYEREALPSLLENRGALRLRGGLLRVGDEPVAMSLASPVSRRVADVQFEKALEAYPGAYAVINQQFVRHELADMEYVNRENDMGIEGLRRAKQSYHPVLLAQKYVVTENI